MMEQQSFAKMLLPHAAAKRGCYEGSRDCHLQLPEVHDDPKKEKEETKGKRQLSVGVLHQRRDI